MKTLLVDMDNVITDFSSAAALWFNEKLEYDRIDYKTAKDFKEYEIWKAYGFDDINGTGLLNEMFDTSGFWRDMPPVIGCINSLRRLNEKARIFIITSPVYNDICIYEKYEWIKVHLPFIKDEQIIFSRDKSVLCGDVMVDDYPENLRTFKGTRILFIQPYNYQHERRAKLSISYAVADWVGLERLLNGIIQTR